MTVFIIIWQVETNSSWIVDCSFNSGELRPTAGDFIAPHSWNILLIITHNLILDRGAWLGVLPWHCWSSVPPQLGASLFAYEVSLTAYANLVNFPPVTREGCRPNLLPVSGRTLNAIYESRAIAIWQWLLGQQICVLQLLLCKGNVGFRVLLLWTTSSFLSLPLTADFSPEPHCCGTPWLPGEFHEDSCVFFGSAFYHNHSCVEFPFLRLNWLRLNCLRPYWLCFVITSVCVLNVHSCAWMALLYPLRAFYYDCVDSNMGVFCYGWVVSSLLHVFFLCKSPFCALVIYRYIFAIICISSPFCALVIYMYNSPFIVKL